MLKITKKNKRVWVTFEIDSDNNDVVLVGEWNNWQEEKMKKKKNGNSYLVKYFSAPISYQYGFKINNEWIVDETEMLVDNPFGGKNNLLKVSV